MWLQTDLTRSVAARRPPPAARRRRPPPPPPPPSRFAAMGRRAHHHHHCQGCGPPRGLRPGDLQAREPPTGGSGRGTGRQGRLHAVEPPPRLIHVLYFRL
jgi:hypothetical protein